MATNCQAEAAQAISQLEQRVAGSGQTLGRISSRRESCCSSGSIRRSIVATGALNWSLWPAVTNAWADRECPRRTLAWNEVLAAQPEVMLIACCGFDVPGRGKTCLFSPPSRVGRNCPARKAVASMWSMARTIQPAWTAPGRQPGDSGQRLHPRIHRLPPGLPPAEPAFASELSE